MIVHTIKELSDPFFPTSVCDGAHPALKAQLNGPVTLASTSTQTMIMKYQHARYLLSDYNVEKGRAGVS